MKDWCSTKRCFAIRLITGRSGVGKSRLARELCSRLIRLGWSAGLVNDSDAVSSTPMELDQPTLLVIDSADLRVPLVVRMIERLAGRPPGSRGAAHPISDGTADLRCELGLRSA